MKIKPYQLILLGLVLCSSPGSSFSMQFMPNELSQRPEIERLLKTAEIIDAKDVGEGVTKPYRLYLSCESGELSGCWKNPQGKSSGYLEGWKYEIAAYEMDKLLGLNMIPPTVQREYKGKKGSFQFWVTGGINDMERMEQGIDIPEDKLDNWDKGKYLMRAFDSLIANEDRTQQNIRYTDDWRMILIDHSRSFRSSAKHTKSLMYGTEGIKGQKLIRRLPRRFVEKIRALDYAVLQKALGPFLSGAEINALLKRRLLLLEEIQKMIETRGESNFLY